MCRKRPAIAPHERWCSSGEVQGTLLEHIDHSSSLIGRLRARILGRGFGQVQPVEGTYPRTFDCRWLCRTTTGVLHQHILCHVPNTPPYPPRYFARLIPPQIFQQKGPKPKMEALMNRFKEYLETRAINKCFWDSYRRCNAVPNSIIPFVLCIALRDQSSATSVLPWTLPRGMGTRFAK